MTAADRIAYQRAYQNARQRALNRLAKAHPGEYASLLAEERAATEQRPSTHPRLTHKPDEREEVAS